MTFHERSVTPAFACAQAGGAYGWLTPYLAQIAMHNRSIATRILDLPRAELHFIALTLALMGDKRDDPDHLAAFARGLGVRTRKSLLCDFAPDATPHLAQLATKLAGRPWRATSYRRLAALFAEPHARKVLNHLPYITRWRSIVLGRLPAGYRRIGIVLKVKQRTDLTRVVFAIEVVRRIRTDLNDRQILASLEKSDMRFLRRWVEVHYEKLPFPAAPSGAMTDMSGGVLRPVTSGAELSRASRDFNNCVANYLWEASTGASVFYRYDRGGKPIAMAEIKRLPAGHWAIDELEARNNDPLDGATRQVILGLFCDAGILPAPQVVGSFSWFDLD